LLESLFLGLLPHILERANRLQSRDAKPRADVAFATAEAWLPKGRKVPARICSVLPNFLYGYETMRRRECRVMETSPAHVQASGAFRVVAHGDVSNPILFSGLGHIWFGEICNREGNIMKSLVTKMRRFLKSEDGPTAVEYAVMLALIIIVCLTAITAVGTQAAAQFNNIATQVGGAGS
jgi:pilus assembly protein Flp/PilA